MHNSHTGSGKYVELDTDKTVSVLGRKRVYRNRFQHVEDLQTWTTLHDPKQDKGNQEQILKLYLSVIYHIFAYKKPNLDKKHRAVAIDILDVL
jgi:hypothetical protein